MDNRKLADDLLLENATAYNPTVKLDTLCTILKNCTDDDIDFLLMQLLFMRISRICSLYFRLLIYFEG